MSMKIVAYCQRCGAVESDGRKFRGWEEGLVGTLSPEERERIVAHLPPRRSGRWDESNWDVWFAICPRCAAAEVQGR